MRHRRKTGFTLIELLVVISIIIILASFLIVGLLPQRDKALRSKTQAIVDSVSAALALYYNEFHDYPPDGYDKEPNWNKVPGTYPAGQNNTTQPGIMLGDRCSGTNGKKYRYYGTGCLIYFLCYPVNNVTIVGADQGVPDPRNVRISPCNKGQAFLSTLKKDDFSVSFYDDTFDPGIEPGSPNYKGSNGGISSSGAGQWNFCEIVDAYKYPLHYDKVGNAANYTTDTTYFQPNTFHNNVKCHSDQYYLTTSIVGQWTPGPNNDVESNCCPSNTAAHMPGTGLTHADPRVPPEPDGCLVGIAPNPLYNNQPFPVPRNPGSFDLWAHGKYFANGISAMTNWK